MSIIGKLIGVLLAGQGLANSAPLFSRLLSGIAAIIGLAILCAILGGVLLTGAIFMGYHALINHGLEPEAAMLVMAMAIVLVLGILVAVLCSMIAKVKDIPASIMEAHSPITSRATNLSRAFIEGFSGGRSWNFGKTAPRPTDKRK